MTPEVDKRNRKARVREAENPTSFASLWLAVHVEPSLDPGLGDGVPEPQIPNPSFSEPRFIAVI